MRFFPLFILLLALAACHSSSKKEKASAPEMVRADGKGDMILLTDRPINLETPLHYFLQDYTPNDVFFVRWHLSNLPTSLNIDRDSFRLRIGGHVQRELALSMQDLKTKFKPVTTTALCICAGNTRSCFVPRVAGAQWMNGGMGNAKWTGVRLKDVLEMAGIKPGAVDVSFNGLDVPPQASIPDYVKSLSAQHCMEDEVLIAYEMNGYPLPRLNGYPLKLVVPGWYATYWIGMLSDITVLNDTFEGFWMKKAYLKPKGVSNANEQPDTLAKNMEPINKIAIRSLFVSPTPDSVLQEGKPCEIIGLAFDGGDGIVKVELTTDSGTTWIPAQLDPDLGRYSWRRWRYVFTPKEEGTYHLSVRATNKLGETQPAHQWNRSGYSRNEIEEMILEVQ